MSSFLYKVSALGDGVKLHRHLIVSPITADEFLSIHNHDEFDWEPECLLISDKKFEKGETVFFLNKFLHAKDKKIGPTLPVVVEGKTPEELKKSILDKIETLYWHPIYVTGDIENYPANRWEKFSRKLDRELPGFMEDLCRALPMHFKMNHEDANDEPECTKVKVTLYKGTVAE